MRLYLLILIFFATNSLFSEEYFIKLKPGSDTTVSFGRLRENLGKVNGIRPAFRTLREMGLDRVYVLDYPGEIPASSFQRISELCGLEYMEPVPVQQAFYTPNDYNATQLWHIGKISAPAAWDIERGGKGIVIGLVDDGMDTAHSDLNPVLWRNTGEIRGNGIDDDNNGYVDDHFGWDVADNDNNPSVTVNDALSHGTHCAGIAGPATDNNNGIAGIGFNVKIMPVKTGRNGQRFLYNTYNGVEYAVENGARVISMSFGGGAYSRTWQTLFDVAYMRNIVCVAAAGNSNDSARNYPASYRHVIAVGSTSSTDAKSSFSCYGTWVDVMAPGSAIYSTLPGNSYGNMSGTSMACPMVSGLCALMLSRNPNLTVSALETCLKNSCDNINSQNSNYIGWLGAGRINAENALKCVKPVNAAFTSSKNFVCTGDTVSFRETTFPASSARLWSFPGGSPSASSQPNPVVRYNTAGTYKVTLIATRNGVSDTVEKTAYITVGRPTVRFSGNQTIAQGEFATIRADLTGMPPWNIVMRSGNLYDTIRNVMSSPYFIPKLADTTRVFKPVSVSSGNCTGIVYDSAKVTVVKSNNAFCDSSYRFHLSFGGSNDDQVWGMSVADDSIVYISGLTRSNGAGGIDAAVAKVGHSGKIYWYRTLGGSQEDGFMTLATDKNQNVYCGGYSHSNVNYRAAMMVKYNRNGTLLWKKYYNGIEREYIYDAIVSKDQKYVYFTGHSISDSYGGEDYVIYKLDTSGNVQWVKRFGSTDTERPYALMEDDTGDVYALGNHVGSGSDAMIIKMSSAGALRFSRVYMGTNSSETSLFTDAAIWSRQHMYTIGSVVLGSGNRRLIVSKMTLGGSVVWTREIGYGNMGSQNRIMKVNGKLVISGWVAVSGRNYGFIMTLDSNANVLSARQIGNTTMNLLPTRIDANTDNSITYAGYQNSGNNQYMIGKTNCSINNACLFASMSASTSSYTLNAYTFSVSTKDFTSVVTPSHTNNLYSLNSTFNCKTVPVQPKKNCRLRADFTSVNVCTGDSAVFSDRSLDSNAYSITLRQWDFGDGSRISGPASVKHRYTANGNYKVRLIVISGGNGVTCSDTIEKTYKSADTLLVAYMPADTTICRGDSLMLMEPIMSCGKPPYTFTWTPTTGIDDPKLGQPYFAPRTSTTYTVTVRDQNGRSASSSFRINVNTGCCKSKARFRADKPVICQGDSVQFINESTHNSGSSFFRWVFTGANISSYTGFNPPKVIFNGTGVKSVSLELTDICADDTQTMLIFPRALPQAFAGRDTTVCRQDTLQLGSVQLGRNAYLWSPSTGLDNPLRSDPTAIITTNVVYRLKVTDENGCVGHDTVNIGRTEARMFIRNDTSICSYDSLTLTIPGTGQYLWSTGSVQKSIVVKQAGTYWGELRSSCNARDTVRVQIIPSPSFTLGRDTFICQGKTVSIGTTVAGTYLWNTGANTAFIAVGVTGNYILRVSNGACSSADTIAVTSRPLPVFTLGSNRTVCRDSVQLSPAPAYPLFTHLWSNGSGAASVKTKTTGPWSLRITDPFGCSWADTVTLSGGQMPRLDLEPVYYKCLNTNFVLSIPPVSGQTHLWYDQTSSPSKPFMNAGRYSVKVSTVCGDTTYYFNVNDSDCSCNVWVPNAISLNRDGKNETFGPVSECSLINYSMRIFNRWGELLFSSFDPAETWDGTYKGREVPQGVYIYIIEFQKDMPTIKEYNMLKGPLYISQ